MQKVIIRKTSALVIGAGLFLAGAAFAQETGVADRPAAIGQEGVRTGDRKAGAQAAEEAPSSQAPGQAVHMPPHPLGRSTGDKMAEPIESH